MKPLTWGYTEAVPDNARGAWGARAIVTQDGTLDFLHDRQSFEGDPDVLQALTDVAPLNEMIALVKDLLKSCIMHTREDEPFVLAQTDTITVVANTKASAGYVYIAAWVI